jgi:hypothetical protein
MKKEIVGLYVISILPFFLSACNDSDSTKQYYLKDQWKISSANYFQVKNKPKEVTEYFYAGENNISQNNLKEFGSYDQFIYDQSGNLLNRKLFFKQDMWYEFKNTYSKKGYGTELITKNVKGLTRKKTTDFEIINDSICRETLYDDPLIKDVSIYHYKKGGNEIVKEQSVEATEFRRKSKRHYWYNGQQILKETFVTNDGEIIRTIETQYYYDTNNYLDSIVKRTDKVTDRTIFKKNKFGDPIYELQTSHKDTSAYKTYTYLYDSNNNWIKRLEENHKPSGFNPNETYTLIVREIKY